MQREGKSPTQTEAPPDNSRNGVDCNHATALRMDDLQHTVVSSNSMRTQGMGRDLRCLLQEEFPPGRGLDTISSEGGWQTRSSLLIKCYIQGAKAILHIPQEIPLCTNISGYFPFKQTTKKVKKKKQHINCCLELFLSLFCMSACQKCQYIMLTSAESKIRSRFSPGSHSSNRLCFFYSCGTFPKDTQRLPRGLSPPHLHMEQWDCLRPGL